MSKKEGIDAQLYEDLRTQIVVKNAGGPKGKKMNGKYDLDGTWNGRKKYKHVNNEARIFFDQIWLMSCDEDLEKFEYKNVTELEAELVPEGMWAATDPASLPAPDVVDEWMKRWNCVRVFHALHPSSLVNHIETVVSMLTDSKDMVRLQAVTTLGRLPHQELEKIADTIAELIEREPKESVREAAIKVLLKLDATDLSKHMTQICHILDDQSSFVRLWALLAIDKLEDDEKTKYELEIERKKEDEYMPIREKAGQMIRAHRIKIGVAVVGDD